VLKLTKKIALVVDNTIIITTIIPTAYYMQYIDIVKTRAFVTHFRVIVPETLYVINISTIIFLLF